MADVEEEKFPESDSDLESTEEVRLPGLNIIELFISFRCLSYYLVLITASARFRKGETSSWFEQDSFSEKYTCSLQ